LHERISVEALLANTLHGVANHKALGIKTTASWTWVDTLLVHTGQLTGAVRAGHTLWAAVWRATNIGLDTGTGRGLTNWATLRIRSTGRWATGINGRNITNGGFNWEW